jgi:hypothetical protein
LKKQVTIGATIDSKISDGAMPLDIGYMEKGEGACEDSDESEDQIANRTDAFQKLANSIATPLGA